MGRNFTSGSVVDIYYFEKMNLLLSEEEQNELKESFWEKLSLDPKLVGDTDHNNAILDLFESHFICYLRDKNIDKILK